MQRLKCCHQEYDWGKIGEESRVGTIVKIGEHFDGRKEKKEFDGSKPYAELWMGTHKNGPSYLYDSTEIKESLKDYLQNLTEDKNFDLPFLFKVLSVRKALSIQTHPTKEQAELLHARDPKNYPDDNHKPEMAIAVTEFQVLCGFAPWEQIVANLEAFPEVKSLTSEYDGPDTEKLEKTFTRIWKSSPSDIANTVQAVISRITVKEKKTSLEDLMIRLNGQFPGGDVGVLAPIFMNYIVLKPGEAVYLGANVPHAYLFGDCIECMACSDNTIRAGLTPKFKDVETLCKYMKWDMGSPPFVHPTGSVPSVYAVENQNEFMIQKWEVKSNASISDLRPGTGANSIWVILQGNATVVQPDQDDLDIKAGEVFFLPSFATAAVLAEPGFLAYSALVPNTERIVNWDVEKMKNFENRVREILAKRAT